MRLSSALVWEMDIFKISVPNGIAVGTFDNTTTRVVPIDYSIVYRWYSEISPVADAFDDSKSVIIIYFSEFLQCCAL